MHSPSPAPPMASGVPAAGCLVPHPAGRGQIHSRVGPLPATPGTARRGAAFSALHSPSPVQPWHGEQRSCCWLSWSASGWPRAGPLKSGPLASRSGHGPEGSCFILPKPRPAHGVRGSCSRLSRSAAGGPQACPHRGAALHSPSPALPTASGTPAAGCLDPHPAGHKQNQSRLGPLPASQGTTQTPPRGELLCTPRAPLRLRRAGVLPPAVLISIRWAAGRSTQEGDPRPSLRARAGGELLYSPRALLRLRRAALLPPAVSIHNRQAAGLSTQE